MSKLNLTVSGDVLSVQDEEREFQDKDKQGNPLPSKTKHRITTVSLLVTEGKSRIPCVVKGFDLPTTFALPKEGDKWTTPTILAVDQKFKPFPELSI